MVGSGDRGSLCGLLRHRALGTPRRSDAGHRRGVCGHGRRVAMDLRSDTCTTAGPCEYPRLGLRRERQAPARAGLGGRHEPHDLVRAGLNPSSDFDWRRHPLGILGRAAWRILRTEAHRGGDSGISRAARPGGSRARSLGGNHPLWCVPAEVHHHSHARAADERQSSRRVLRVGRLARGGVRRGSKAAPGALAMDCGIDLLHGRPHVDAFARRDRGTPRWICDPRRLAPSAAWVFRGPGGDTRGRSRSHLARRRCVRRPRADLETLRDRRVRQGRGRPQRVPPPGRSHLGARRWARSLFICVHISRGFVRSLHPSGKPHRTVDDRVGDARCAGAAAGDLLGALEAISRHARSARRRSVHRYLRIEPSKPS